MVSGSLRRRILRSAFKLIRLWLGEEIVFFSVYIADRKKKWRKNIHHREENNRRKLKALKTCYDKSEKR